MPDASSAPQRRLQQPRELAERGSGLEAGHALTDRLRVAVGDEPRGLWEYAEGAADHALLGLIKEIAVVDDPAPGADIVNGMSGKRPPRGRDQRVRDCRPVIHDDASEAQLGDRLLDRACDFG